MMSEAPHGRIGHIACRPALTRTARRRVATRPSRSSSRCCSRAPAASRSMTRSRSSSGAPTATSAPICAAARQQRASDDAGEPRQRRDDERRHSRIRRGAARRGTRGRSARSSSSSAAAARAARRRWSSSMLRPVLDCLESQLDLERSTLAADRSAGLDLLLRRRAITIDEETSALQQLLSHCAKELALRDRRVARAGQESRALVERRRGVRGVAAARSHAEALARLGAAQQSPDGREPRRRRARRTRSSRARCAIRTAACSGSSRCFGPRTRKTSSRATSASSSSSAARPSRFSTASTTR